jgi:carbon-monoxide dehydrogenase large subunit
MAPDLTQSSAPHRYVGRSVARIEDPRLLAGKARFIDDVALPKMLHAAFVRSPLAHARIASIDTRDALALEGVIAVFTGADLHDDIRPLTTAPTMHPDLLPTSRYPLAIEKVRHVGDPIAVVVARTPYIAEDGRDLVKVAWEPLPPVLDPQQALEPGAALLDDSLGTNNVAHIEASAGDVERAFAEADHVFTKRFHVGRSTGAPIEGRGVIADYDERGAGHLTLYTSSQTPHLVRLLLAPALGMPEARISVKVPDVGGAFGVKCTFFPEDVVIPAVARRVGQPVKWIEDRWEGLAASCHSKDMMCTFETAVDADGTFRGFRAHFITDGGAYTSVPFTMLCDSVPAATMLPSLYAVDDAAFVVDNPLTNKCPVGPVRGVGWASAQTAREVAIDDVARALELDPVELRLRNAIGPQPRQNAFGLLYDGGSYAASLELARDAIGYEQLREAQDGLRARGRYVGVGFSPFVEPTGLSAKQGRANALPGGFLDTASVSMEPDGSVTVTTGFHSHGQGLETTLAQVAADELGVAVETVRVVYGDTDSARFGMGTFASRAAVVGTGTIMKAAGEVRQRLLRLAASMLEASPEDIELREGRAAVKGAPGRALEMREVAMFGYFGGDARPAGVTDGLTATAGYDPRHPEVTFANGCAGAVVEVDIETGIVKLEQIVAVEDCGVVLNPMIVHGQVAGAVAFGIGIALLEDLAYDDDGQFLSGSLMHYLYPTTGEIPLMDLRSLCTPSSAPGGVKGVGEAGTISTPAAIVNAIADALSPFGVAIDRVPVTPTYLREAIRSAGVRATGAGAVEDDPRRG